MYIKTGNRISITALFPKKECWYCYNSNLFGSHIREISDGKIHYAGWYRQFMANKKRSNHWVCPIIMKAIRHNDMNISRCRGHSYLVHYAGGHKALIYGFIERLKKNGINKKNVDFYKKILTTELG